jgi:hypothetical protein
MSPTRARWREEKSCDFRLSALGLAFAMPARGPAAVLSVPQATGGRGMFARSLACATALCVFFQGLAVARAVCRVVEPIEEHGGIEFDPSTMVLYVLAPGQIVGHRCVTVALPRDAGAWRPSALRDASIPAKASGSPIDLSDGGADDDAGQVPMSISPPEIVADAGASADASLCKQGTQLVPIRASVVHMVVQPALLSIGGRAGLVMPVPARPDIHAANADLFDELGARMQPRVVTTQQYFEDKSLGYQCNDPKSGGGCNSGPRESYDYDAGPLGSRDSGLYDPMTEQRDLLKVIVGDGVVQLEQALTTPDYDVTVINASTAGALHTWLDGNSFAHDAQDDAAFDAYVAKNAWFVALLVHPSSTEPNRTLSPLVVSFRAEQVPIMHRLQYDADGGEITTDVFVMAQNRMIAADGSAQTLYAAPAGFGGAAAGFGLAQGWLTRLRIARRMDEWKEDSSFVPTGNIEERPTIERIERIRVPSSQCPEKSSRVSCLCTTEGNNGSRWGGTLGPALLACVWIALRNRRRARATGRD